MQSASKCSRCNREVRDTLVTCGACEQTVKAGEKIHCYDHCPAFMQAGPDERLRQVLKYGNCTICLLRDHDTESHLSRSGGNQEKLQQCGVRDKPGGPQCSSYQNVSLHGAATHLNPQHKQFHTRARELFPRQGLVPQDSGKADILKVWERSGRRSRAEEMEQARLLLKEPEVDGDRVLLLAHKVTLVSGAERSQVGGSIFFDKGSTCSMATRKIV